jgi:hypothetical protein
VRPRLAKGEFTLLLHVEAQLLQFHNRHTILVLRGPHPEVLRPLLILRTAPALPVHQTEMVRGARILVTVPLGGCVGVPFPRFRLVEQFVIVNIGSLVLVRDACGKACGQVRFVESLGFGQLRLVTLDIPQFVLIFPSFKVDR